MTEYSLSALVAEISAACEQGSIAQLAQIETYIKRYKAIDAGAYDVLPSIVSQTFARLFRAYLSTDGSEAAKLRLAHTAFVQNKFKYLTLFVAFGLDPASGNCTVINDTPECLIVEYDSSQLICSREDDRAFIRRVEPRYLSQTDREKLEKEVYYAKVISAHHQD